MAVTSFIATIWAANLIASLKKVLVSEAGVNHNYEGEAKEGGSVKINRLADITVKDYDGNDITYDDLDTTDTTLNIDTKKYFAVKLDDVDAAQVRNSGALMAEAMTNAAYEIASSRDAANFKTMITSGTKLQTAINVSNASTAKALVLKLKTLADKANIPAQGRVLFASPDLQNFLLSDTTINLSAPTADDSLKAGYIGKLYGIEIYSSNNIIQGEGANAKDYAILTTPIATTEASQISNIEAMRSEKAFKDIIRGLDVSGRKVIIPEAVIVAEVTYNAE